MKDIVERMRELEPSMTVGDDCKDAADEIERLRAKIEATENQEPVSEVESWTNGSYARNYRLRWHKDVAEGTKLYTLPGAQPAPIAPEGWKLVPITPTDEMLRAHLAVDYPYTYKEFLRHPYNGEKTSVAAELDVAKASRRWASMLAAAPEAKR